MCVCEHTHVQVCMCAQGCMEDLSHYYSESIEQIQQIALVTKVFPDFSGVKIRNSEEAGELLYFICKRKNNT